MKINTLIYASGTGESFIREYCRDTVEIIDLAQSKSNIRQDEKIRGGINYIIDSLKHQLADNRKLPFLSLDTAKINLLFGEVMHAYNANM